MKTFDDKNLQGKKFMMIMHKLISEGVTNESYMLVTCDHNNFTYDRYIGASLDDPRSTEIVRRSVIVWGKELNEMLQSQDWDTPAVEPDITFNDSFNEDEIICVYFI